LGQCGPETGEVSRREFIELAGIGVAGVVLGASSGALGESQSPRPEDLERWKKALLGPTPARVYDSGTHVDARMHLGGIGTGNFEIGADGQFTMWQLFNTLRDGEVPFCLLARAGKATRLLQTRGGPDWPRIKQIAMTGRAKGATHGSLVPESGLPLPLRGGGAQFPTEILGQFANRHRLKDGNRKTPCQPSAMIRGPDGGKTP